MAKGGGGVEGRRVGGGDAEGGGVEGGADGGKVGRRLGEIRSNIVQLYKRVEKGCLVKKLD